MAARKDEKSAQLAGFAQFTTRSLGERDIDALMLDAMVHFPNQQLFVLNCRPRGV
jgi:hypothetical protein